MVTSNAVQQPRKKARRKTQSRQTTVPTNELNTESGQQDYIRFRSLITSYAQSRHVNAIEALGNTSLLTFMDWLSQRSERAGRNIQTQAQTEQPRAMTAGAAS